LTTKVNIVYDGLCLFCLRSLGIVRALDIHGVLEFQDANDRQTVLRRFPQLADVDLDDAMYAVDDQGRVYSGFYAFRRIARTSPLQWPLYAALHFPGMSIVGERVYALVARNRRRLGCRIDTKPEDA
jgi:predicted DCC family thiol-disulfide oxidoreductase YuxK